MVGELDKFIIKLKNGKAFKHSAIGQSKLKNSKNEKGKGIEWGLIGGEEWRVIDEII